VLENSSDVCLRSAGDTLEVLVQFRTCLSSSCDTLASATCSITAEGTNLLLEDQATIKRKQAESCTSDCGLVTARCSLPDLAPGQYRILRAGDSEDITLPADEVQVLQRVQNCVGLFD